MKLLVDLGNTRLKWATLARGKLQAGEPSVHAGEALGRLLSRAWAGLPAPGAVVVSSVAGARRERQLRDWLRRRWQLEAEFLLPARRACGVVNAYPDPQRLGADRWAALLGARAAGLLPACVVDCGTAVTVDLLDAAGVHQGGLIVPGLRLAPASLTGGTGQIAWSARAEVHEAAAPGFARNTLAALHDGALYQLVALLDRVYADSAARLAAPLHGLLTGGDAPRLLPLLRAGYSHRPDLVLEGLAAYAARRRGGARAGAR
ncbi:MAG TPA: type III pantothenate kinase [Gammaproteobacteria bacterium]